MFSISINEDIILNRDIVLKIQIINMLCTEDSLPLCSGAG